MPLLSAQGGVHSCKDAELATGMVFPTLGDLPVCLRYSNTADMADPDSLLGGDSARDAQGKLRGGSGQGRASWKGLTECFRRTVRPPD